MKKSLMTLFLALTMLVSLALPTSASFLDDRETAVAAMGIIEDGKAASTIVTRSAFAKMLVTASYLADNADSSYGYTLFDDVPSSHWASAYIQAAVDEGWMSGYSDGTFRPDQTVKLEEGVAVLLKVLGYDSTSIVGAYPDAYMAMASRLGLLDGVSATTGAYLNYGDSIDLFYNLMLCTTSSGVQYGTSLGYTITNNALDYSSLITENLSGPYVTETGYLSLSFTPTAIYRDGTLTTSTTMSAYDVYYYHTTLKTVWVYSQRASGTITDVSPSTIAPTSVTVGGMTYALSTSSAKYAVSAQGPYQEGDIVTLLLGMDGGVVGVVDSNAVSGVYYGVTVDSTVQASSSGTSTEVATEVICSDGLVRTFLHNGTVYGDDVVVRATVSSGSTTLTTLYSNTASGTVNSTGTALGSVSFSSDIQILDIDDTGNYVTLYPSQLAGFKLSTSDVRLAIKDDNGDYSHLILDAVTGNTATYAFLSAVEYNSSSLSASGSYTYILNGSTYSTNTNNSMYGATKVSGVVLTYSDSGQLSGMQSISSVSLDGITDLNGYSGTTSYTFADNMQVIICSSGKYYPSTLSDLSGDNWSYTGWYDNTYSGAQTMIRVLVAVEK